MARLRLDIDAETFERLREVALRERRLPGMQAEVLLRQALGLPFPSPETEQKAGELAEALRT